MTLLGVVTFRRRPVIRRQGHYAPLATPLLVLNILILDNEGLVTFVRERERESCLGNRQLQKIARLMKALSVQSAEPVTRFDCYPHRKSET